jgi:hypothetical protein
METPDEEIAWPAVAAALRRYAARPEHREEVARTLAPLLTSYAFLPDYRRFFQIWEEQRVHLTPVHFYSPVPDTRALPDALWQRVSDLPGIDMNDAGQLDLLRAFRRFQAEYDAFPHEPVDPPYAFHFANTMFSGTDALALYGMVRHVKPARILEVGSGFSTRISAQALVANGAGELTCIEPFPDDTLRNGFPGLTALIASPVQAVPLDVFGQLQAGDILFIDSSHVVKCGSDVNWLYLDVLPRIAPGVYVHLHDIFLPREYPEDWLRHKFLFWSEQYLLQAFLAFNAAFEVVFANAYLAETHLDELKAAFPHSPWWGAGGSFWMRRKPV